MKVKFILTLIFTCRLYSGLCWARGGFSHEVGNHGEFHHESFNHGGFNQQAVNRVGFFYGGFSSGIYGRNPLVSIHLGVPYNYYGGIYYPPTSPPPKPTKVHIEKTPLDTQLVNHWYYCTKPAGYFPEVKECESGWSLVIHQN